MSAAHHQSSTRLGLSVLAAIAAWLVTAVATAETHTTLDAQASPATQELRVELPIEEAKFRDGELQIDRLVARHTYLVPDDYLLRAVEIDAVSERGSVRLKVGRYLTPEIDLPRERVAGATLRIEAPYRSHRDWRLVVTDRARFYSLTAVVEPREPQLAFAPGRAPGRTPDQTRAGTRRYSTAPYTATDPFFSQRRYERERGFWGLRRDERNLYRNRWYWLNDRNRYTDRILIGPTRTCYDRFGRHRLCAGRPDRNGSERHDDTRTEPPRMDPPRARPLRPNPTRAPEPVMRTPTPPARPPRQRLSAPFERAPRRATRSPIGNRAEATTRGTTGPTRARSIGSDSPRREPQ
ncbi:MAG: hypothetical protein AAF515_11830 [Pseudomonadota bacterium]